MNEEVKKLVEKIRDTFPTPAGWGAINVHSPDFMKGFFLAREFYTAVMVAFPNEPSHSVNKSGWKEFLLNNGVAPNKKL